MKQTLTSSDGLHVPMIAGIIIGLLIVGAIITAKVIQEYKAYKRDMRRN